MEKSLYKYQFGSQNDKATYMALQYQLDKMQTP